MSKFTEGGIPIIPFVLIGVIIVICFFISKIDNKHIEPNYSVNWHEHHVDSEGISIGWWDMRPIHVKESEPIIITISNDISNPLVYIRCSDSTSCGKWMKFVYADSNYSENSETIK